MKLLKDKIAVAWREENGGREGDILLTEFHPVKLGKLK